MRSWYLVLERTVKFPGTRGALTKMVLDQAIFAPTFLSVFVTAASTMQGLSLQVWRTEISELINFRLDVISGY